MHRIPDSCAETSTTTGTGAFTVDAALTGHTTLNSQINVGDTFTYVIKAVDGSGNLTGESETGVGTLTSASAFSRNKVVASSNGGALVNFSAGDKYVFATMNSRDVRQLGHNIATASYMNLV